MRHNLSTKQSALGQADAVVAVSRAIARDLKKRCPEIGATRVETIPNMVDLASIEQTVATAKRPLDVPYAVYVGKLSPNKGSGLLPEVIERAGLNWPLVVIGDGPERAPLEAATRGTGSRPYGSQGGSHGTQSGGGSGTRTYSSFLRAGPNRSAECYSKPVPWVWRWPRWTQEERVTY